MRRRRHLVPALVVLLWLGGVGGLTLGSCVVFAAPPVPVEMLRSQGLLLDDQGDPRTGSVDLTLRIYDAATSGQLLYTQVFAGVPLSDGVFQVELGPAGEATDAPVSPLSTSLADALTGDLGGAAPERFLEVTVGSETALARTRIRTTPYALRAGSAVRADSAGLASQLDGASALYVQQLFEFGNSDATGAVNADPTEGVGDTDADGVANFIDPDNDADGLDDGVEVAQGSDPNLSTPVILGLDPASGVAYATNTLLVQGENFVPGLGVTYGVDTPTPVDVTPSAFQVDLSPRGLGSEFLTVTLANGETDGVPFSLNLPTGQVHGVRAPRTLAVRGERQVLLGGFGEYGVDTTLDGVPDVVFPLVTDGIGGFLPSGEMAVTWSPFGDLLGLRCRTLPEGGCAVEVLTDSDADLELEDEAGTVLESGSGFVIASSLAFDTSGPSPGLVAGYVAVGGEGFELTAAARVAHDRDGDGLFTGPNELVVLDSEFNPRTGVGEAAVDAAGRVAYAYVRGASGVDDQLRVARDRNGDGDFDDTISGNPELSTLTTGFVRCLGMDYDPSGRLVVVHALDDEPPVLSIDTNGDGDFADPGETTTLGTLRSEDCDVAARPSLVVVHTAPGTPQLLVDRNGDGDFDDGFLEDVRFSGSLASLSALVLDGNGRAVFVSNRRIYFDPAP